MKTIPKTIKNLSSQIHQKAELTALPFVTVKEELGGKSFTEVYKPYSMTKKEDLAYFLKIDLRSEKGIKDFGTFIRQAMQGGYSPIAGPTFTLPSEEMIGDSPILLNLLLEKEITSQKQKSLFTKKIVYAASPARFANRKDEIMLYVSKFDKACLHPFHALPYEYFEGGGISREDTMTFCCKLVDMCDEFWLFGISDGTMLETAYFLERNKELRNPKPIRILINEFDLNWKTILKKNRQYKTIIKNYAKTLKTIEDISDFVPI